MEIERFNKRVAAQARSYEEKKKKLREHYRYARAKGFSAKDSQALSFETKEFIDQLATERLEAKGSS